MEVLKVVLQEFDHVYVVIDGLDECPRDEKKLIANHFLATVAEINENSSDNDEYRFRCCFVSQADMDTGRLFRKVPSIKISKNHNKDDIFDFCSTTAKEIVLSLEETGEHSNIPTDQFRTLVQNVSDTADGKSHPHSQFGFSLKSSTGMFLYAKLVMDQLRESSTMDSFEQAIKTIPPTLNAA
jgi:hypothetical protein